MKIYSIQHYSKEGPDNMIATWNSAFETGIQVLDEQHKELFRMLRDLEQMVLTECKQYEYEDFVHLICEIRDYMTYHFYTEEKLMQEMNYPEIDIQRKAHGNFKDEINKINYIELQETPLKVIEHLRSYIELWIMQHMLLEDVKIGEFFK